MRAQQEMFDGIAGQVRHSPLMPLVRWLKFCVIRNDQCPRMDAPKHSGLAIERHLTVLVERIQIDCYARIDGRIEPFELRATEG